MTSKILVIVIILFVVFVATTIVARYYPQVNSNSQNIIGGILPAAVSSTSTTTTTFMGKPAIAAGFDPTFSTRRVATMCPDGQVDFANPWNSNGLWCVETIPLNTYYSSMLDSNPMVPNPNPVGDSLQHGFYMLNNPGVGYTALQPCKVNAADCWEQFAWQQYGSGQLQVNLSNDARVPVSQGQTGLVMYAFGERPMEINLNYFTGGWYIPNLRYAGLHVAAAGKVLNTNGIPSNELHYFIETGFGNPTTNDSYDIAINIGSYGNVQPEWSSTTKYAMIRTTMTNGTVVMGLGDGKSPFLREIFIGAGNPAWGLPVLDLSSENFVTYDIDWQKILNQMVTDGVIPASDLNNDLNGPGVPSWMKSYGLSTEINWEGSLFQVGTEVAGGIKSELLVRDFRLYNFNTVSSCTSGTVPSPSTNAICSGSWTPLSSSGSTPTSAAIGNIGSTLIIAVQGTDNHVWAKEWNITSQSLIKDWYIINNFETTAAPKIVVDSSGLHIYVQGTGDIQGSNDGNVWVTTYKSPGNWIIGYRAWATTDICNSNFGSAGPNSILASDGNIYGVSGTNPVSLNKCTSSTTTTTTIPTISTTTTTAATSSTTPTTTSLTSTPTATQTTTSTTTSVLTTTKTTSSTLSTSPASSSSATTTTSTVTTQPCRTYDIPCWIGYFILRIFGLAK